MTNTSTQQLASTQQTIVPAPLDNTLQINIGLAQGIIGILVFIFGIGWAWGNLKKSVQHIEKSLDEIKPDVKDLREKMAILWQDKIAPAHSPRQLNSFGLNILNTSGIKEIVEDKKVELANLVKLENPTNPYDAEGMIQKVMVDLPNRNPDLLDTIKNGAFKTGVDINTVLFVGSIYLRNLIFVDLGFNLEDLDIQKKS